MCEMKPVIIIAIAFVLLIPSVAFAQTSEESLGHFVTGMASNMMKVFLILIIPALIILYLLKRKGELQGVSLKGISVGLGLLFLGTIIIGMVSTSFHSDEENARAEAEREKEWKQEIAEIKAREAAEFESATVPSGSLGFEKLKYRAYWLVDDEWNEKERTGKIVKSQDCVNAVTIINDNLGSIRKTFYKAWLIDCVK